MVVCKPCTTIWKMWLGWVEHQHEMSLTVANCAQNLGFPHGNAFPQSLRCSYLRASPDRVHSLASPPPQAALSLGGYGNLPDISTPHFSTGWKRCVPP